MISGICMDNVDLTKEYEQSCSDPDVSLTEMQGAAHDMCRPIQNINVSNN